MGGPRSHACPPFPQILACSPNTHTRRQYKSVIKLSTERVEVGELFLVPSFYFALSYTTSTHERSCISASAFTLRVGNESTEQEEEEEELSQSSVLLLQDKRAGRQAGVWDLGVTPQRRKETKMGQIRTQSDSEEKQLGLNQVQNYEEMLFSGTFLLMTKLSRPTKTYIHRLN